MKSRYVSVALPFLMLSSSILSGSDRIAGIAIATNDHVYAWFTDGVVTSGTSGNFEKYEHARPYSLPPGKTPKDIVAMSIAGSNDHVYAWYDDGTVSSGTTGDLDKYRTAYKYKLPKGKVVGNLVGIGIGANDRVHAWYDDDSMSVGTTDDLDSHRAPAPSAVGKKGARIVEVDIAKSTGHVYVWYDDGTARSLTSALGNPRASFGYIPSQVLYTWWGPGQKRSKQPASGALSRDDTNETLSEKYPGVREAVGLPLVPQPRPDQQPEEGEQDSPAFAKRFLPGSGAVDPMIAVGNQHLIVSTTGSIAFFDKQGNPLPEKNGIPGSLSTAAFFEGFVAENNADGSLNESNLNLYMDFPKPCDTYPQTMTGKQFCIGEFYDTRVTFDSTAGRFFVIANARHALWDTGKYGGCGHYITAVSDPSKCDVIKDGWCIILATAEQCALTRRYVVFAVSRTEDPRDGFHQYAITESNNRDWPWMTVNGDYFISAHKGDGKTTTPVATVFSVEAITKGRQHPPYFRYYSKDVDGSESVSIPRHHQSAAGLTFLLGRKKGERVDIYALPPVNDPWVAPTLLKTSVTLDSAKPTVNAAVYRAGKLYLVGPKLAEQGGRAQRYSVRVVRIPVEQLGASQIQASKDAGKGFLDRSFGDSSVGLVKQDRHSYEYPAIAVNKRGDMLVGYGKFPFASLTPFKTEARYSLWYAGENRIRRSALLQEGLAANSDRSIDYATAVVDPSDDTTFWVALPYAANSSKCKTVVGKIFP